MTEATWKPHQIPVDLAAVVSFLSADSPDMPASLALSVKQFDALCRLIPCQPVTPMRVAALRLKELTRADG